MSQLPPPTPPRLLPPDLDYFPQGRSPLGPARRAGMMLIILGALAVVGGLCGAIFPWFAPGSELLANSPKNLPPPPPGMTSVELLRIGYTVVGAIFAVLGTVLIAVGLFARKGRRWALITSLVLCVLGILYFALNLLSVFLQWSQNPAMMIGGACVTVVPMVLLILTLVWLMQAVRVAPQDQFARQQYQMQMWQQRTPPAPSSGKGWQSDYGMTPPPPPPP